jgi:hypothetical protein
MVWRLDDELAQLARGHSHYQKGWITGNELVRALTAAGLSRQYVETVVADSVPWLPGVRILLGAFPPAPNLFWPLGPLFGGLVDDQPVPEVLLPDGWRIIEERPMGPWWASLRIVPAGGTLRALAFLVAGDEQGLVRGWSVSASELWFAVPAELTMFPASGAEAVDGQLVCRVDDDGSIVLTAHTWPVLSWGCAQFALLSQRITAGVIDGWIDPIGAAVLRQLRYCHNFQQGERNKHPRSGRVSSVDYALLREIPTTASKPSEVPKPLEVLDLSDATDVEQFIVESQRLDPIHREPVSWEEDAAVIALLDRWISERGGPSKSAI